MRVEPPVGLHPNSIERSTILVVPAQGISVLILRLYHSLYSTSRAGHKGHLHIGVPMFLTYGSLIRVRKYRDLGAGIAIMNAGYPHHSFLIPRAVPVHLG